MGAFSVYPQPGGARHTARPPLSWLLFVVFATVVAGGVGQKELDRSSMGNGESKRGQLIIEDADFPEQVSAYRHAM